MIPRAAALAIGLILGGTVLAMAGGIEVSPPVTVVAKPVDLILTVDLRPGEAARAPEKLALPEGVELEEARREGAAERPRFIYRIIPYRLGEITIPPVEYTVLKSGGSMEARRAGPVSFVVESVRDDPETADELKDIRPLAAAALGWTSFISPLLALAVAGAALYLAWRWYSRRRAAPPERAEDRPPTPCEAALAAISRLRADDPFGAGRFQEHFFRLSRIVREYVERRYGIMALERTTPELEIELDRDGASMPAAAKPRLLALLKVCDMVKFAGREPSRIQADEALRSALDFVEITRLKTAPEEGAGEVR